MSVPRQFLSLPRDAHLLFLLLPLLHLPCCRRMSLQGRCTVVEQVPEEGAVEEMQSNSGFTDLIQELPKDFRMIFVLYYGEGFCTREIAELLDISENTVKSRLRRGRMKLSDILQHQ